MTQAATIIESALEHLGAHSPINPAPPETINRGLEVLVEMLYEWEGEDFRTGAAIPDVPGDDLTERRGTRAALEYGLAFKMASVVRKDISQALLEQGNQTLLIARERFQFTPPDNIVKRTIPGQGNRVWR